MATIYETAKYVRSKNAGPFWITIDIFCESKDNYEKIIHSPNMNRELFAGIYGVEAEAVKIFFVDSLKVVKISIPRKTPQGQRYERDMHSGQQYVSLLDVEL